MEEVVEINLAGRIWELEQEKKRLSDALKSVQDQFNEAQREMIDYLVEVGKSSTGKIDGVGTFTLKRELYPNITKDKLGAFIFWLKQRGEGALVQETVPSGTLKSYLRDLKENLITQIEDQGDEAVKMLFGVNLAPVFVNYLKTCERQAEAKGGDLSIEERAAVAMELLGCYVHQEVKLSHTGRGAKT